MKSVTLSVALACAVTSTASAHVVFNQTNLAPNALATLELRVTHGCNSSPTNQVTITLPQGVTRVTPRAMAGWEIQVTKRRLQAPVNLHGETMTETIDTITWRGGSFPDFTYQQFEIRAMMPSLPGTTLYFPVQQSCAEGAISWSQIPQTQQGWGSLATPAPFVTLSTVTTGSAPATIASHRH
jgi:periplasmic copper chaperone A